MVSTKKNNSNVSCGYMQHTLGNPRRPLAETAMPRFKKLMMGKLSLQNYNNQVGK